MMPLIPSMKHALISTNAADMPSMPSPPNYACLLLKTVYFGQDRLSCACSDRQVSDAPQSLAYSNISVA